MLMQRVVANLGKPRRERFQGRDWLVATATLIPPDGVLNGSDGPGLYPAEESRKAASAWNIMPLVLWHPQDGMGQNVTARSTEILEEFGVGNVFAVDGGDGMKSEAWFDVELLRNADQRFQGRQGFPLLPRIESGGQVELSTGLFPDRYPTPGVTANGTRYEWVARNLRPDHVAILPDEVGACSVADGCGVNNGMSNNERMCWGHPCADGGLSEGASGASKAAQAATSSADAEEKAGGGKAGNEKAAAAHHEAAHAHFAEYMKTGDEGALTAARQHVEAKSRHLSRAATHNSSEAGMFRRFLNWLTKNAGDPSADINPAKACQILKDGEVRGRPLTEDQRGMFGAACGNTKNTANTWSDAAREAAAEARRAKSGSSGSAAVGGKEIEASRQSDAASEASSRAKDVGGHVDAATEHMMAAKAQRELGRDSVASAHKKAAEEHLLEAAAIKGRGVAGQTRNASTLPVGGVQLPAGSVAPPVKKLPGEVKNDLPWDECVAEVLRQGGSSDEADAICGGDDGTDNQRTNKQRRTDMALTANQRKQLVADLAANCACNKGKEKVLNQLDDDQLEMMHNSSQLAMVVNAVRSGKRKFVVRDGMLLALNADGGEAAPGVPWPKLAALLGVDIDARQDPVGFTAALKGAVQKIIDALTANPAVAEDAIDKGADDATEMTPTTAAEEGEPKTYSTGRKAMTEKQFYEMAPPSVRNRLKYVERREREDKVAAVKRLLSRTPVGNRQAMGDFLYAKDIDELNQLLLLNAEEGEATAAPEPKVNWALAGGGAPVLNEQQSALDQETVEMMEPPTSNSYREEAGAAKKTA